MKFLIDVQLPPKLCETLESIGLESIHVNSLPNGDETSDTDISLFVSENNLIVVTKDSDFYHAHMLFQKPEKLLLINTGNIKNRQLFDLIRISDQRSF
jgi:predicted nuclease of predicted toxin-antitoxin system